VQRSPARPCAGSASKPRAGRPEKVTPRFSRRERHPGTAGPRDPPDERLSQAEKACNR